MLAGRRTHKRTAQGRRCACARHSDSKHFAPSDASVAITGIGWIERSH
jgi:hypothetical protein